MLPHPFAPRVTVPAEPPGTGESLQDVVPEGTPWVFLVFLLPCHGALGLSVLRESRIERGCLGPAVALFFFLYFFPWCLGVWLGVCMKPTGWLPLGYRIWGCSITLHNPKGSQGSVAKGPSCGLPASPPGCSRSLIFTLENPIIRQSIPAVIPAPKGSRQ